MIIYHLSLTPPFPLDREALRKLAEAGIKAGNFRFIKQKNTVMNPDKSIEGTDRPIVSRDFVQRLIQWFPLTREH